MGQSRGAQDEHPAKNHFLNLFPLYVTKPWFANISKLFSNFLWKGKKPRINVKKVSLPRDKGGPIPMYYLAFNAIFPLMCGYQQNRTGGSWD